MESAETKVVDIPLMTVAYIDAWYVIDMKTLELLSGPFRDQEDATVSMTARAYRIGRGWAP